MIAQRGVMAWYRNPLVRTESEEPRARAETVAAESTDREGMLPNDRSTICMERTITQ